MKTIIQGSAGNLLALALILVFTISGRVAHADCTPPPTGIVSWWPGEGNADDVIGANNGILEGGLGFTQGKVGQAFFFDATNLDVKIPASATLNVGASNGFTLEAWILCSNVTALNPIFEWNRADGTTQWGVQLYVGGGGPGTLWANVVDAGGFWHTISSPTGTVVTNVFQHVALTYDQTTGMATLYYNGLIFGQANLGIFTPQTTYNLYLGHRPGPEAYYTFSGLIDEPSIYDRALSADEIAAIYNAGSAGKCGGSSIPSAGGPPVITSVSPSLAVPGTSVTISGSNFNSSAASNIVYFGSVKATVSSANATGLTVTVPTGAIYAPITVTVGGRTAYSSQPFVPTFTGSSSNFTASSLAPAFTLPADSGAGGTAIGDLDGDGRPDLVVINVYTNTLWIYRNLSTNGPLSQASFDAPVILQLAGNPYAVVLADLDGDGRLDIVVTDNQNNQVSVFRNLCIPGPITANSFGSRVDFPVGHQPIGLAVADLNGDGFPDVVTANLKDNTISVLQNTGAPGGITSSTFAAHMDFPTASGPEFLAVGDLDGDGKPDIAVSCTTGNSVSVLRNQSGGGSITAASLAPHVDFAGAGGGEDVFIGDVDGDGKPDLLQTGYLPSMVSLFQNLSVPGSITTNSFGPRIDFATGGRAHRVALSDLDGDGKPDVAVTTELPNQLLIFKNISTPGMLASNSLASPAVYPTGWNPNSLSIADLDGDGRPDVFLSNVYDHDVSIYQNLVPFGTQAIAPGITTQPANLIVPAGGAAVFTVAATGTPPLSYQWSFNGTNIPAAINSSLTLSNVLAAQAGDYSVLVSNGAGSIQSSNAILTITFQPAPPTILAQTPSQIVLLGNPATFGVTAGGSPPLSYFWSRNNALIADATNASYTLPNAQLSDSGSKFSCLVTNAYGMATSTDATLKVIDTISNDLCSGAVVVPASSYTNFQSTANASSYGDPQPDCVDGFGNGVWYQFTAPANGLLYVDTFGSDFDTGLAAYIGSCESLTEIACNDDAGGGVTSQIIFPAAAGTTYYFLAGGYGGHVGNLVFHLNYFTPPVFVTPPANQSVVVDSNALFSPAVVGSLPISFQWYFNNTPLTDGGRISGSTNLMLAIADVQTNDRGNYVLVASNFVGITTSSVAVLTPVILPPAFIQPPVSQLVGLGSNATFFATVSGTAPFSYTWSFNGQAVTNDGVHIAGQGTSSLTISNVATTDGGVYSLVVANGGGSTQASATLTLLSPPVFTLQPIGRSVPPGLPTTFNAAVSGTPASYQWQLNGTNLPGATTTNYSISAIGTNDLGIYQLLASNTLGIFVSSNAQLTFGPVAAWGRNFNNECLPPPGLSNVVGVGGSYANSFALLANGNVTLWGGGFGTPIPAGVTNVVALVVDGAAGNVALRADGTVVGWQGPIVPALSNVVAVAAGGEAGLALRAEGTVVGWGNGPISSVPVGLNHISAIAVGTENALALRDDGKVVAWGYDLSGTVPAGLTNVTAIAAGNVYNLALKADGTVVAWGSNSGIPLPAGLTNVTAISTIDYSSTPFSLALRTNGTVVAWGDNSTGETNIPPALTNLFSVAISAAPYHGLALVNDGSPQILHPPIGLTANVGRTVTLRASAVGAAPLSYQWRQNGTNLPGATATSLVISNVQFATAGSYQLFVSNSVNTALSLPAPVNVISNSTLVFLSQNSVLASNVYQGGTAMLYGGAVLGNGPLTYQWFWSPTNRGYSPVAGATNDTLVLNPALAVQSGYYYLAASNLMAGVTSAPVSLTVQFARAWGYNAVSNPPVNVTNAIAVATGGYNSIFGHYLALGADGKVSAWANYPTLYGETNVAALSNSFVTAIAAGVEDSLALKSDGTVYAWGYGSYGETNVPTGLNNVAAIACGSYHDLALKADGTVAGWGGTGYYNFGQATNDPAATNVVAIAAGAQHSLALRADGTVVGWGYGLDGSTEVPVAATNVVAIAAGSGFSVALRGNGTVVQWGTGIANYPVPPTFSNVVAIAASGTHVTALHNDGTVTSWGYDYESAASSNVPSDVANVVAVSSGGNHDFALLGNRAPVFTVQPWDQSYVAGSTVNLTLTGKVVGAQPVSYQWLYNGAPIKGATNDSLVLTNRPSSQAGPALAIQPGAYQLVASNAYAVVASKPVKITAVIPLGLALNNTSLIWTTTGDALWYGQTNYSHDGVSAARSGGIGGEQETILQTTLATNYAGTLTFWWEVSSEPFFDFLEFRLNGFSLTNISGAVAWQPVSLPLPAGTNLLQWRYYKDPTVDVGLDAGFVDQVSFIPNPPQFIIQPASITTNLGASILLTASAIGAPAIKYQWWQNGNPVGSNSPVLALNNVGRAQNGVYSVTVSNVGGATISSNAIVHVNVPQLLGAPRLLPSGALQFTSTDANGGMLSLADLPNFEAQVSSDLVNWVTLPNALSLTNGMLSLSDPAGTGATTRYYRILEH